jgi:hypothetical protein
MYAYPAWNVDASHILSRRELALVHCLLRHSFLDRVNL